jgi:DNA-binding MarR family transcriptional regulator
MPRIAADYVSDQVWVILDCLAKEPATTRELAEHWEYVFGLGVTADTLTRLLSRHCRAGLISVVEIPNACTLRGERRVAYSLTRVGRVAWQRRRDMLNRALGVRLERAG